MGTARRVRRRELNCSFGMHPIVSTGAHASHTFCRQHYHINTLGKNYDLKSGCQMQTVAAMVVSMLAGETSTD